MNFTETIGKDSQEIFEMIKKEYVAAEVTSGEFLDDILSSSFKSGDINAENWDVIKEAAQRFCEWDEVPSGYIDWEAYDRKAEESGQSPIPSSPAMDSAAEDQTQTPGLKQ